MWLYLSPEAFAYSLYRPSTPLPREEVWRPRSALPRQPQCLLGQIGQRAEELRPARAINDSVVARQAERHHRLNRWRAIERHDPLDDAPDRQDRGLWRGDDGVEGVHAIHTEIADGERRARQVVRALLARLRALDQLRAPGRDLLDAEPVGPVDDRNDQPVTR